MKIKSTNARLLFGKRFLLIAMRAMLFFMCTTAFCFTTEESLAQQTIVIEKNELVTVNDVFKIIKQQTDFNFAYPKALFKNASKIQLKKGEIKASRLIEQALLNKNLTFELTENNTIIFKKKPEILEKNLKSQDVEISGTVKDSNDQPLPGANILEKGTENGTQTDFNGKFSLEVADVNAVLTFSYIGFKTKEIQLNGKTSFSIVLEEDAAALEEVVLTGIRASQQRAVSLKKNAVGFVDAITSESAGKLPDGNVAEALQRVPGVTISRTRGQGDFISIRGLGPEFARGSLNGRSIVSASTSRNTVLNGGTTSGTGRATNFDVLPSDIIETIEVFKTSSAEHVEGGIGGSVNIKTVRPLDFGNKVGFNIKGTSFRESELSPSVSTYGGFTNKSETFGAFVTGSYSNRNIREDNVRAFIWSNALDGRDLEEYFPFASSPEVIEENRERITISVTAQWRPSDKTDLTFDATYSRRNLDYNGRQVEITTVPLGRPSPIYELDESSLVSIGNNSLESFSGVFPAYTFTDGQQATDDIFTMGLNLKQELGNKWIADIDLSLSSTTTDFNFQRGDLTPPDNAGTAFDILVQEGIILATPTDGTNFSDASRLQTRSFRFDEEEINDSEFATRIDISKELNSGFFSKFKTGLRYRGRTRENIINSASGAALDTNGDAVILNVADSGVSTENGASNFLQGDYTDGLYESFTWISDLEEWVGLHEAQGAVFNVANDPNRSFEVKENTLAFYGQLDIDGKLGDFPITGNIGARLVNTNITVNGNTQELELVQLDPSDPNSVTNLVLLDNIVPFSQESSYFNFLPSLNLKLQASENTYVRAAYSKSITRPQFSNLGGYSFNTTNNQVTSAGNAGLNPYESNNYDVGMEWYTGGTGVIGISFFYKSLSSFVTGVSLEDVDDLGNTWDQYVTFENQGEGSIVGTEISIQQPLKFLPGVLKGLGVIANFTFADGEQELNDGSPIAFPGVSDFSFNSALYYDNGGKFQARLAYTYRDDFLILPNDVLGQEQYNDAYAQLDASISFKLSKGLTLFGEAVNLTDERNILYTSNPAATAFNAERPVAYQVSGTRFSFGLRGSF